VLDFVGVLFWERDHKAVEKVDWEGFPERKKHVKNSFFVGRSQGLFIPDLFIELILGPKEIDNKFTETLHDFLLIFVCEAFSLRYKTQFVFNSQNLPLLDKLLWA